MSRSYRFDNFRIIPALRELWRDDRRVALPPQVFDCLTYLIEHHERAVGRDELVAAVWGKTAVSDTLLGQTVLRIRRELGDDAKEQRVLRTIPRFGYRWAAPLLVEEYLAPTQPTADAPAPAPEQPDTAALPDATAQPAAGGENGPGADVAIVPVEAVPAPAAQPQRRSTAKIMLAALAAALVIGVVVWGPRLLRHATTGSPSAAQAGSLVSAVLPALVDANGESAWMRLGMMEAVATHLRSGGLPSVPSEDVVALLNAPAANRSGTPREALGASLLVTPRVQRAGDDWQVGLDADDGAGRQYTVDARGHDAVGAARAAADKLLAVLGMRPVDTKEESDDAILVRRIDAAALADDLDAARALFAQASPEQQRSPEVRLRLAKIDFRAGHFDAARERLVAMLDEAPAKTAPVLRASILNGLGSVALAQGQPEQASRYFGESIPLLESRNEPEQLGQGYIGRAAAAADQDRYDEAAADYARARIAYRQANDNLALLRVAADEGFADYGQRRPGRALPQLEAAAKGFEQWGALREAILTYVYQVNCHLALLDGRAAMQAADAAEVLAQRIDNRHAVDQLRLARARALAAVGRLHEARAALDGLRSGAGVDADIVAGAGNVLARIELEGGRVAMAQELAEQAVSALSAPNHAQGRAEAWLTQLRAELQADPAKATATLAAFEEWAGRTSDSRAHLLARLADAEHARKTGSGDWRRAFAEAGELAARDGLPYEIATVARSYAEALLAEGDLEAAAVEVGRVSRWSDQDFGCAVLEARLYAATGRNDARQTAVARARALAGERVIPDDALSAPVSTRP
ncbi:MAG TPA: transcriptional regulator [Rhodanobacteraceae bacterium]|nr:transcriptional regulator [Rhodanobacteraceae bacterium]